MLVTQECLKRVLVPMAQPSPEFPESEFSRFEPMNLPNAQRSSPLLHRRRGVRGEEAIATSVHGEGGLSGRVRGSVKISK